MSDAVVPQSVQGQTAGALLRTARERAGVHIGVVAATLKVPVHKLELLERDRYDELHDATFVRALSLSVCRLLKCDPSPVLEALPRQEGVASTLEQVSRGVDAPFPRRRAAPVALRLASNRLGWWIAALILALAGAVWWAPGDWWSSLTAQSSPPAAASPGVGASGVPQSAAQAASASTQGAVPSPSAASAGGLVQTVHGAPQEAVGGTASIMSSSVAVTEPCWIEVADLQGRPMWARTLTPGEAVALDGSAGLRLTIGNAAATQIRWRGQTVDLTSLTRDNVARLDLK